MDELTLTLIAAMFNGIALAIGMIIGTRMTGSTLRKELKKFTEESPTAKRLLKLLEKSDELLASGKVDELIERVTTFFDEATTLVSSPEAKNFFANVTELMKQLSGEEPKVKLKLPKRPKKER